ncbi:MAG TPA: aminoglycoside phosphotransferase family protein [Mycobacteriales bacterium]|nr:aminoglycoside phosphotransferase family protein [Mycobacteriales bacterium]
MPDDRCQLPGAAMVSTHDVRLEDDAVVKQFRSADRGEPEREWRALHALAAHAPGLAPRPLAYALAPPTVTMSRLPGTELGGAVSADQLTALGAAIDRLFRVPLTAIGPAPAGSDLRQSLGRVRGVLPDSVAADSEPAVIQAHEAATGWLSGPDADRLPELDVPPVLARGDYNLANFLWDGEQVRMLDFEDSGRGNRATELALLMEHLSVRETPDLDWLTLVDRFGLTPAERQLMAGSRRLEAIFWFALLQPGGGAARRNPPGTLDRQAERVLALLDSPG